MATLPVPSLFQTKSFLTSYRGCYGMPLRCPLSGLTCSSGTARTPVGSPCWAIKVSLLAQGHTLRWGWGRRNLHLITGQCEVWRFEETLLKGHPDVKSSLEGWLGTLLQPHPSSASSFLCPVLPWSLPSVPAGLILRACPRTRSVLKSPTLSLLPGKAFLF